jgi:hypothetical protein
MKSDNQTHMCKGLNIPLCGSLKFALKFFLLFPKRLRYNFLKLYFLPHPTGLKVQFHLESRPGSHTFYLHFISSSPFNFLVGQT